MPGFFSNGPYQQGQIPLEPPLPPSQVKPRRNVTRIIATRVSDGEEFEFLGWAEIERIGFSHTEILNSLRPARGQGDAYLPTGRPYLGFRWIVVSPQTRELPPDTYLTA